MDELIRKQDAIDAVLDRMDIEKYGRDAKPEEIRWTLEKLPPVQSDVPVINVGDMISRQAAIDSLHMHLMYRMGTDSNKKRLDEWINNLPPAEPRPIRCRDCYWWTKQEASLQGRCALTGTYPTGAFFCGNAKQRPYLCDPEKNTECSKTGCYINGGECRHTLNREYAREEE